MAASQVPQSEPEDSAAQRLSAEDFRTYNQMAEQMDLFVRALSFPPTQ